MPNIKSAEKRVRISEKQNLRNRQIKSVIKTRIRHFDTAVQAGDSDTAQTCYREAVSALDRAARKGTIHKNLASRKKAQLSVALAKAQG